MNIHQDEAVRLVSESAAYLKAAPQLLEQLTLIDREHGSRVHDAILIAEGSVAKLIQRRDLPVVERRALVEIAISSAASLINLSALRCGDPLHVDVRQNTDYSIKPGPESGPAWVITTEHPRVSSPVVELTRATDQSGTDRITPSVPCRTDLRLPPSAFGSGSLRFDQVFPIDLNDYRRWFDPRPSHFLED